MAYQTVFKRYELKYMLTSEQKSMLLRVIDPYMALDKYGRTTIRNIYFDTPDYRLIRNSIERPVYKEKLRIRSYGKAQPNSTVFVELKKKYKHIVYKRRLPMLERDAMEWLADCNAKGSDTQISAEIEYFMRYYQNLHPQVFLSYEREAFYCKDTGDFRITFDDNILFRTHDISLCSDAYGTPLLSEGKILMELKCSGGLPLWMTSFLSEEGLYKTSFSKYGTAYRNYIFPQLCGISCVNEEKEVKKYVN